MAQADCSFLMNSLDMETSTYVSQNGKYLI